MLLAIDVGNTHIVVGVYEGEGLLRHWRLKTDRDRTTDEIGMLLLQFFASAGLEPRSVRHAIACSVVPPLSFAVERAVNRYFGAELAMVGPGMRTGMPILYDSPREVGADRIVNAVAAYERVKQGVLVVDFGTATTVDCVSPAGEYLGGVIVPGVQISLDALIQRTAKLPRVEIAWPQKVVGRTTVQSIQSGLLNGYVALVDGLIEQIREELDYDAEVIATGGLARTISSRSKHIREVDPLLTLEGLRILSERSGGRKQ
jgi:type III pantothenate kinase